MLEKGEERVNLVVCDRGVDASLILYVLYCSV
jgi:hypothetical protein